MREINRYILPFTPQLIWDLAQTVTEWAQKGAITEVFVEDKGNRFFSHIRLEGDSPTGFFSLTVIGEPGAKVNEGSATTNSHLIVHRPAA